MFKTLYEMEFLRFAGKFWFRISFLQVDITILKVFDMIILTIYFRVVLLHDVRPYNFRFKIIFY